MNSSVITEGLPVDQADDVGAVGLQPVPLGAGGQLGDLSGLQ
jgi:hypothetical protein